jgi:adenylate cyclase, class 2
MEGKLNLELKARDPDPERSLRVCEELGAEGAGVLQQRDVYFEAVHGRLKLRYENGGIGQLIAYERPDQPGVRASHYRVIPVLAPSELEAALTDAVGVIAEVQKTRRLFLYDGVRIHLDRVEGLGRFIELEAPVERTEEDRADRERLLEDLWRALGVQPDEFIAGSYCDLIRTRAAR